jgi:Fe-S-cluster containining protein
MASPAAIEVARCDRAPERSVPDRAAPEPGTPPPADAAPPSRQEIEQGLAYLHGRVGATAGRAFESAAFVYALIELVVERGILTIEEIDARKKQLAPRLLKRFESQDEGVAVQDSAHDKYQAPQEVQIDCASRLHLCKAACCKMVFPLSQQDVKENVVHWELGRPYVIAKGEDGYCRHLERTCRRCTVHAARPLPCRVYDCRNDGRVWLDFEGRVINPKLADPAWPHNLSPEERNPGGIA